MSGFLSSLCAIFIVPIIALALEPSDPVSFCDRFVDESTIEQCQKRTSTENVDWYAGSLCNMQKDDAAFWKCWDSAKDKSINLTALKKCEEDSSDLERQACIESAFSAPRRPASANPGELYQAPPQSKKKK